MASVRTNLNFSRDTDKAFIFYKWFFLYALQYLRYEIMITFKELQQIALSLPEAYEEPHFEKTSFRIKKKNICHLRYG